MKYFLNSIIIILAFSYLKISAQTDTISLEYKFERCIKHINAPQILQFLEEHHYTREQILSFCTYISYHGNDKCANEVMNLCIAKHDSTTAGNWHTYSVQNTKHGNYAEAFQALEKSYAINFKEMEGYFGWVLLYYYRDYARALSHLNHYDDSTPKDVDAPVGENIHFLKGLCYYQLNKLNEAINEFKLNEDFEISHFGKKNCNTYIYFYIARCYEKLNDLKQAEKYYCKAITQAKYTVEAKYYLALLYKQQNKNEKAKKQLNSAIADIKLGYKQQDIYVELFDEVYYTQLMQTFNSW